MYLFSWANVSFKTWLTSERGKKIRKSKYDIYSWQLQNNEKTVFSSSVLIPIIQVFKVAP